MPGLFKNILVPVDFSTNTEIAVNQAIELACTSGSTISLLHVLKPKSIRIIIPARNQSGSRSKNYCAKKALNKLQDWKYAIEGTISNCKVNTYVVEGAVHINIQNVAKEIKPQLIIISKKNDQKCFTFYRSVCPNELAKSTGFPVLTIMKRTVYTKIKIIVVPVGSFIPKRKIELVVEFAKKYRARIHLVTLQNKTSMGEANKTSFLETYRILKTGLNNPIEHYILKGNNFPKAILEYAECIGADMIFVNPGTETQLSNLTGKHINDALTSTSKLKILSIEPNNNNGLAVLLIEKNRASGKF
jgi:nucleotide-binding universal stress UspA family protein